MENNQKPDNHANGEKRLRELFDLNVAIMEIINSDLPLNATLETILKEINKKIPYTHGAIFLPDKDGSLEMIASEGYPETLKGAKFKKGIIKYVYDTGNIVYEPEFNKTNWENKPYHPELVDLYPEMNSVLVIPLGKYGVFELFNEKEKAFSADTIDSLMMNSSVLALTIQNVKLREIEAKTKDELIKARERERNHILELTSMLFLKIENTDVYSALHSPRVAYYSREIAKEMGFDEDYQTKIYNAALLHDIGKCEIEKAVRESPQKFSKTNNPIKIPHVIKGEEILRAYGLENYPFISDAIKYHHEWFDGDSRGYLRRAKNKEIPLVARIIAVADVYEALTSERPYRSAFSKPYALRHIMKRAGTHFDPEVVKAFLKVIKRESLQDLVNTLLVPIQKLSYTLK
ncbi:MAG: HD domain-containing protein [Candidatus Pacearchaeota archaeon]|nr:HD domain-containing protein [Candidatus Pacearchaeota archaeon]